MEQRNSAQESARSAEAQLRVTLESAPVGICRIALDGTFVEANARFSAITGYSSAELLNRHFHETSEAEAVVARFRNLARAVPCEDPFYREEKHHVRKDGTALWVVLMLSFVRDRNGRPQFAVGLLQEPSRSASRRTSRSGRPSRSRASVCWPEESRTISITS